MINKQTTDLMSTASSAFVIQHNRGFDCLDELFKLEAGMSRGKAAEWLHLAEFNLRMSTVPQDRWVRMAVDKVDSHFKRMFEGWEQEETAWNFACGVCCK